MRFQIEIRAEEYDKLPSEIAGQVAVQLRRKINAEMRAIEHAKDELRRREEDMHQWMRDGARIRADWHL